MITNIFQFSSSVFNFRRSKSFQALILILIDISDPETLVRSLRLQFYINDRFRADVQHKQQHTRGNNNNVCGTPSISQCRGQQRNDACGGPG